MKRNDIKNLAKLSQAELQQQLSIINLELSKAKLAKAAGKLANLRSVSSLKDDVARIKTVLRQIQMKPPEVEVVKEEVKEKTEKEVKTVKKTAAKTAKVVKKATTK